MEIRNRGVVSGALDQQYLSIAEKSGMNRVHRHGLGQRAPHSIRMSVGSDSAGPESKKKPLPLFRRGERKGNQDNRHIASFLLILISFKVSKADFDFKISREAVRCPIHSALATSAWGVAIRVR
jgi:hypothetical protein